MEDLSKANSFFSPILNLAVEYQRVSSISIKIQKIKLSVELFDKNELKKLNNFQLRALLRMLKEEKIVEKIGGKRKVDYIANICNAYTESKQQIEGLIKTDVEF